MILPNPDPFREYCITNNFRQTYNEGLYDWLTAEGFTQSTLNDKLKAADSLKNLLTYSEEFDNAAWFKSRLTVTPNAAVAPDGATTADQIVADGTTDPWIRQGVNTGAQLAGRTFTFSIWLWTDAGQPTTSNIYIYDDSVGDVGTTAITITTTPTRYSFTHTFGATEADTVVYARFDIFENATLGQYLYAWGAQLEASNIVGPYLPTTSSPTAFDWLLN